MTTIATETEGALASRRLARLTAYLDDDPTNLALLADIAAVALEAGNTAAARTALSEYAAIASLPPALINLDGLIALAERRYDDAADAFSAARAANPDDPGAAFNSRLGECDARRHSRPAGLRTIYPSTGDDAAAHQPCAPPPPGIEARAGRKPPEPGARNA